MPREHLEVAVGGKQRRVRPNDRDRDEAIEQRADRLAGTPARAIERGSRLVRRQTFEGKDREGVKARLELTKLDLVARSCEQFEDDDLSDGEVGLFA